MTQILVHFQHKKPLLVNLENSQTSALYLSLLRRNLSKEDPIWRDLLKYDLNYFKKLAGDVNEALGWNWDLQDLSHSNTTRFHKDIEALLAKEKSFDDIPGEHQQLIHEIHHCLHNIEVRDENHPRGDFLQFEWFNGDYEKMPEDKQFTENPKFGDIILQNPYVGHPPLQCYMFNDYKQIDRTCAFQDRIKPALKIGISEKTHLVDKTQYIKWWNEKCPLFVEKMGMETIMRYTGWPVIGEVEDKEYLRQLVEIKELNFEGLEIL